MYDIFMFLRYACMYVRIYVRSHRSGEMFSVCCDVVAAAGGVGLFGVYGFEPTREGIRVVADIPPVIHVLQPGLTWEEFRRLKKEVSFQSNSAHVCEACFMVYAQVCSHMID